MTRPKYYCSKCKCYHWFDKKIGQEHLKFIEKPTINYNDFIRQNFKMGEIYTLDNIRYKFEDAGLEDQYYDLKKDIEMNQQSNSVFITDNFVVETKSGVMNAEGLMNMTKHAKLIFHDRKKWVPKNIKELFNIS